jgi:hypothetical protein
MGFIGEGNVRSLKAGERAGFPPFVKRQESWFLFRRRARFLPVSERGATTLVFESAAAAVVLCQARRGVAELAAAKHVVPCPLWTNGTVAC